MGLFSRSNKDLTTPEGAVAHLLKRDPNRVVRVFRSHREYLTAEVASAWDGRSREERLEALRTTTRYFLTLTSPGSTPIEQMPDSIAALTMLAGAKSRILGFLWEQNYGQSMLQVSAGWEPFSAEEMDAMLARDQGDGEDGASPGAGVAPEGASDDAEAAGESDEYAHLAGWREVIHQWDLHRPEAFWERSESERYLIDLAMMLAEEMCMGMAHIGAEHYYLSALMRCVGDEEREDRRTRLVSLIAWDLTIEVARRDSQTLYVAIGRDLASWIECFHAEGAEGVRPDIAATAFMNKITPDQTEYERAYERAILGWGLALPEERLGDPDIRASLPLLLVAIDDTRRKILQLTA